jgi:organic radical activating enzyme
MHLSLGKVHSCHHPYAHKIDPVDVQQNPSLLFNTPVLKTARKEMLSGERPSECNYCWRVEDSDDENFSDRHLKSSDTWAIDDHDTIASYTGDEDIYPSYLEVSFNNACNLKCLYCGPEFSSKWAEEIKSNGQIPLLSGTKDFEIHNYFRPNAIIKNREYNPYTEAFWKWWPEVYKHLQVFRITGGEPLMSKDTFKSLDWFIENPNKNLELCINSNFSVEDSLWKKFIDKIITLQNSGNVKTITIYTSVEAWAERAEYIRTGLDFNLLLNRIDECLSKGVRVDIMAAFNILSLSSYKQLLQWVLSRKKIYNKDKTLIAIDTAYVRGPDHLDAIFLTSDLLNYLKDITDYVKQNISNDGYHMYEYEKVSRIYSTVLNRKISTQSKIKCRAKFFDYINELDTRYGVKFLNCFPEYSKYYRVAKKARKRFKDIR